MTPGYSSFAVAAIVLLAGCATQYQTLRVDEKSGLYPTSTTVDPGGVLVYDTSVAPKSFKYVLLITNSNNRPSGFSFTVRSALAQAGLIAVYTPEEFRLLAQDRGFTFPEDRFTSESLRRFSTENGRVLVLDYTYRFLGNASMSSLLVATDGSTGKTLLRIDHPKHVFWDFDGEALYPVLNQLRKWIKDSAEDKA